MDLSSTTRRNFLGLALGVPAAATLAACGGSGPTQTGAGGGTGGDTGGAAAAGAATYWFLSGQPQEGIREATVKRYNEANPDAKIKTTKFQNDAYKTKVKTAIGAGQGPTIIWGWGGGGLKEYVKNDQVEDLTSFFEENTALKDKIFPSTVPAANEEGNKRSLTAGLSAKNDVRSSTSLFWA